MTITLDLTPTEAARLVAAARQEGVAPEQFVKKLVADHLPPNIEATFAEIVAPVHEYSRQQGYSEEEIGAFVDAEIKAYRSERRARQKAETSE